MRKVILCLVASLFAAPWAAAGDAKPATYNDPLHGFSFEVPALGDDAGTAGVARVIVTGPRIDGFATNCNVQIQNVRMGHAEFIGLSLRQFEAGGLRLLGNDTGEIGGRPATRLEYAGAMSGRELHFLGLVVSEAERTLLLTCTTLESRFATEREALLGVIASFSMP